MHDFLVRNQQAQNFHVHLRVFVGLDEFGEVAQILVVAIVYGTKANDVVTKFKAGCIGWRVSRNLVENSKRFYQLELGVQGLLFS